MTGVYNFRAWRTGHTGGRPCRPHFVSTLGYGQQTVLFPAISLRRGVFTIRPCFAAFDACLRHKGREGAHRRATQQTSALQVTGTRNPSGRQSPPTNTSPSSSSGPSLLYPASIGEGLCNCHILHTLGCTQGTPTVCGAALCTIKAVTVHLVLYTYIIGHHLVPCASSIYLSISLSLH
jgi:hypothetical protein